MQSKAKEYATEDRLHNFRVAAVIQRVSAKDALAGMMAKHTVSVYDMCGSEETFSQELWDEKITDSINYLLLLRALVQEEEIDTASPEKEEPTPGDLWIDTDDGNKLYRWTGSAWVPLEEEPRDIPQEDSRK